MAARAVNMQARFHVLQEVELLVARGRPEVVADVGQRSLLSSPSSLITAMLDFFPKGGLVNTMS
jgi:hypothetical protein